MPVNAGVCLLNERLSDTIMQNVAAENNLSETAFLVKREEYEESCFLWLKRDKHQLDFF